MGTIQHHAIFVCGYEDDGVQEAHAMARELFAAIGEPIEPQPASLVTPIIPAQANGYASFFIAPDGSKEGWDASENGDRARIAFTEWLREDGRCRFVEVRFGEVDYRITAADEDAEHEIETWLPFIRKTVFPNTEAVASLRLSMQAATQMDREGGHIEADKALVEFVRACGLKDIADAFEAMGKWYA